jgi:hypothetical protein
VLVWAACVTKPAQSFGLCYAMLQGSPAQLKWPLRTNGHGRVAANASTLARTFEGVALGARPLTTYQRSAGVAALATKGVNEAAALQLASGEQVGEGLHGRSMDLLNQPVLNT